MLALLLVSAGVNAEPLKLWHAYRGGEEQAIEAATKAFTAETGIEVELLSVPYDAFSSKITSAIPHEAGPDVFIFAHERLRQFHRLKVVAPTTSRLEKERYFPSTVAALEVDGELYGYPLSLKTLALFVNTALVKAPPSTTAAWVETMAQVSDAKAARFGLAYAAGDFYLHAPFVFGFGAKLFDETGRASFDTPGMEKSLTFVKSLQDRGFMPQEVSGALVKSLFNDGRAAMVISGPWFTGEIEPQVAYRIVPLPIVSETGLPLMPFLGVEAALVSAKTKQPEQAHALAKFLSLGKATLLRVNPGRQIPAEIAAYEQPEVLADSTIAAFKDVATRAVPTPNTLEMARVWEPMKLALRGVLQGEVAPGDAGKLAERRYRALNREKPESSSPLPFIGLLALAVVGLVGWQVRGLRGVRWAQRYPHAARGLAYVAPAALGIAVLIVIPFAVGISLAFFHHEAGDYTFVGLANFVDILTSKGYRLTEPLSFWFTLVVTIAWTFVNVALHVSIGLFLAILLKDPLLKLRAVYRVLLIVPWAVPNYITALMWKGMFHRQFGAINGLLAALGLEPVSWFTQFSTSFAANVITNTWLGFPFMMVVSLGALQSIPQDLYEAAEVDGASKWTQFRRITLPLLKPALLPSVILGSVWTFNMFNIIYLVSGGEPGGATDILVSEAYRWAFQRNEQYGFAAAYSVLIFFVLLGWTRLTRRLTGPEAA
jgi:arabinogalactan oligomer / maltooligosaccharide transport system permease protein